MFATNHGRVSTSLHQRMKSVYHASNPNRTDKTVFLKKLAMLLSVHFQKTLTIAEAWQVWKAACTVEEWLRTQAKIVADVSFWYGIDATKLSDRKLTALNANLPRVKAQQQLENGNFDAADFEYVYNLTLLAFEDEQRALDARANSMRALINRKR